MNIDSCPEHRRTWSIKSIHSEARRKSEVEVSERLFFEEEKKDFSCERGKIRIRGPRKQKIGEDFHSSDWKRSTDDSNRVQTCLSSAKDCRSRQIDRQQHCRPVDILWLGARMDAATVPCI